MIQFTEEDRKNLIDNADNCFDLKEFTEALGLFRQVLAGNPCDLEAMTGAALSALHAGLNSEAIELFEQLLPAIPGSPELSYLLAEALYRSGRLPEAQSRLETLLRESPEYGDAWNRLGRIFMDLEKNEDANRCLKKALELAPDHVEALCNMALMMIKFCHFDDALTLLSRAIRIEPDNLLALNNIGRTCKMQGKHEEAIAWYRKAMQADDSKTFVIDNYLFALNYCPGLKPEFVSGEHFRLADRYLPKNLDSSILSPVPVNGRKLRVGYISGDFYTHSVTYFVEPVIKSHDYSQFEVFCYSVGSSSDATTERMKGYPCNWKDMVAIPPEALMEEVRKDRIDILIDLAGHTADNRLQVFAARSAPVQVSWVGYPNTSGLSRMDYYITDSLSDPPGMTERFFSETLWRLPRIFCCYLPPMEFPPISPPPFIRNGFITFGSFNNFAKVTNNQLEVWSQILKRVPASCLYLKSMALGDESVQKSVQARLEAHGIAPERLRQRVVTRTPMEHLAEYGQVDIALDTFPYHGTTTTCEALWMGTPVITQAGNTHASRVGVSLLSVTGCNELIAENEQDYIVKAVSLASQRERIGDYRNSLRLKMATSPLLDAHGLTRELEEAFKRMYSICLQKAGIK